MKLETARFGEIEIDETKVISFEEGIPGFEELREYAFIVPDETRPLYWMQAILDGEVSLPVIDSFEVLPDYSLDIPDDDIESLSIDGVEDVLVLSVVSIPEDITQMTANLAAPIIINLRLNKGKQILVDRKEYPLRRPIMQDIYRVLKEDEANAGADTESR